MGVAPQGSVSGRRRNRYAHGLEDLAAGALQFASQEAGLAV